MKRDGTLDWNTQSYLRLIAPYLGVDLSYPGHSRTHLHSPCRTPHLLVCPVLCKSLHDQTRTFKIWNKRENESTSLEFDICFGQRERLCITEFKLSPYLKALFFIQHKQKVYLSITWVQQLHSKTCVKCALSIIFCLLITNIMLKLYQFNLPWSSFRKLYTVLQCSVNDYDKVILRVHFSVSSRLRFRMARAVS